MKYKAKGKEDDDLDMKKILKDGLKKAKDVKEDIKDEFKLDDKKDKKESTKKDDNGKDEAKLKEKVKERPGVCSLCSAEVKGKDFRLKKQKKQYEGKDVYAVICLDEHRPEQGFNLLVQEDKKQGFVEIPYSNIQ